MIPKILYIRVINFVVLVSDNLTTMKNTLNKYWFTSRRLLFITVKGRNTGIQREITQMEHNYDVIATMLIEKLDSFHP